ncbi:MAG TPA: carboxypeptidase-like regulatory domain-containing protein [Actinomycetota bacterium]|nr:carboxypeptidase-like regulatory domain-containing protein [Actinomycetota bacterium]
MRTSSARIVAAALALASTLAPIAVAGPSGIVLIHGRITDAFGQPLYGCIEATYALTSSRPPSVPADVEGEHGGSPAVDGSTFTDPDGYYTLAVAPGSYEITAMAAYQGPTRSSCWNDGGTYVKRTRTVDTLTTLDPVDFTLPFRITADMWRDPGYYNSFTPGDQIELVALLSTQIENPSASWTDQGSGSIVNMTRQLTDSPNSGPRWKFEGTFAIPSDRPDGTYNSTFHIDAPGHPGIADDLVMPFIIDTVAPTAAATYPFDGATNIRTNLEPAFWATDVGVGVSCGHSDMKMYVINGGVETLVPYDYEQMGSVQDACGNGPNYNLNLGSHYRLAFEISDLAGNTTAKDVHFQTGTNDVFSEASPTGTVHAPVSRIEIKADTAIDARWMSFRVARQTPTGWSTINYRVPHFERATQRFWIDLDEISNDAFKTASHKPPLGPGTYRVIIQDQNDMSDNPLPTYEWSFVVTT